jgi:hypothetical protein
VRSPSAYTLPFKLALVLLGVFAAIAVTGASAADFETDNGPCPEGSSDPFLLACPTAYVGVAYEIELESEEGSGCTSPGNPYVWYEIKNGSLPAGLTMTREGVISGTPTGGPGRSRFWVWNHDLIAAQGGPSWCQREDVSEKEFSIHVDPGLAISNDSVKPASVGEPYSETLTAMRLLTLNPASGPSVSATWSLQSGALPAGVTLSSDGVLAGTPPAEGSYGFVARAQYEALAVTEAYTLTVRQPLVVASPFGPAQRPSAEVGIRFAKTFRARGGSGAYTWSLSSGTLPPGVALDATKGTIGGTPQAAGSFAFALIATDSEGRVATASAALTVVPRLAIKTLRLKAAQVGSAYEAKLATAGGVKPLKWTLVSGKLPPGVRFAKNVGALVGTPRRAGSFSMVVEARDVLGAKARQRLALHVTP